MNPDQPRVLFVVTGHGSLGVTGRRTGYYLSEVAHPWHVLTEAGYAVDFVSPAGGAAPVDPGSWKLDDPASLSFVQSEDFPRLSHTLRPDEVDAADYGAIFYAGGHGTMWDLPGSAGLADLTTRIYEAGGAVAAVCHGPAGLVNVRLSDGTHLVDGKRVAAFTDDEERAVGLAGVVPFLLASTLEAQGATHTRAPNFQPNVEVDGRLVTGQNPASARGTGEALLRVLETVTASGEPATATR